MRRIYSSLTVPCPGTNNIFAKTDQSNLIHRVTSTLPCRHQSSNSSSSVSDKLNHNGPQQSATTLFNQFPNYCQMVEEAKSRARRSIIIDHCGVPNISLSQFSNVEQVYTVERDAGRRGPIKLSLIEFESERDADEIVKIARHSEDRLLPVPMKIFRYPTFATSIDLSKQKLPFPVQHIRLSQRDDLKTNIRSYSDLVAKNTMSTIALRLRFVTLVNLEQILCSGLFGAYELMPFGSSVIDTGSDSGDLDLVLTRRQQHDKFISKALSPQQKDQIPPDDPAIKLIHLDKSLYGSASDQFGEMAAMKLFEGIIKAFLPLTDDRALFFAAAKVPIIRFRSRVTAIDCDLSFNLGLDYRNRETLSTQYSGIIMSHILYDICRKNNLFTAVVIYFRIFAKITSITSKGPNVGFTNFQLLSMVIFYLQRVSLNERILSIQFNDKNQILPPFRDIMNSRPIHLSDEQLDIVIPKVIRGFFDFYSKFKFQNRALNLYNSRIETKPDNSFLYVVNPMDRSRNICHNVCRKGLTHFVDQCKLAHTELSGSRECPLSMINHLLEEYQHRSSPGRSLDLGEVMFEGDKQIDQPPKRLLN